MWFQGKMAIPDTIGNAVTLDPRLNVYRGDLADARLRGLVTAKRFAEGRPARVSAGIAAVRRRPDPQAEIDTFYHYGEEVLVFDEAAGFAWCQSLVDHYVGYVGIAEVTPGVTPTVTHFIASMGSYR